ncbi:UDP-N-acetylmuramate--L-alanine ligase [Brevundimonas diminuta]|uniref:UDP-N-acetylmuramate--L-alanine ligase n=1 Tax=Brevundimonas diminuta TaxID=293 RepID=UPI000590D365|nr:Mur ligase family protein [Brevundimonas diminuta]OWR19310.1 UDP-N-acetylmuramate--alanine ligase [Brevundimonas diminuta]WQE45551.1 Mur ligase family protein [Brevundimonas diminuta]SPU44542.1 UDP-N-acetylmuramate--L-alanine ligase [Brevundimonas diminuta]SUW14763.1 UDP-N-acetylmuramate--L-alanine ligase [Brevundimonas diminuta]
MNKDYFFCGVGGSGMLPLAMIVQAQGNRIAGSDRALDQGRTPDKFDWLRAHGVTLHPQDGSGVVSKDQVVVATGAVEDTVPDIGAAKRVGALIKTRPQLLSELFNAAPTSIGVAGTSGKSTITGMIAWILDQAGRTPTVVNGAVMKNFADADHPFASALIGGANDENGLFVAEVDESDGSIARYDPTVAVVSNISLDHKSMEELRDLFGGFVGRATTAVLNLDNPETAALAQTLETGKAITFALGEEEADLSAHDLQPLPTGMTFEFRVRGEAARAARLNVPGAHNVANALAALGAVKALGVGMDQAVAALETFSGIRRRLEVVGARNGVTVIDDFAHNPDKIAATLKTLHAFDGRLLILFQPHGFGPLKLMQREFIEGFAGLMRHDDVLLMPEPVYYGGTTDRSVGSEDIAVGVRAAGRQAQALATRADCGDRIVEIAQPGDRIVVMGARDDSLSTFAAELLARL